MTDDMEGTGDELFRFDAGELGEVIVKDDGCSDSDVILKFEPADEFESDMWCEDPSLYHGMSRIRQHHGIDTLRDELADAVGSGSGSSGGWKSRSVRMLEQPVSFKCADCGRTFPRTRNTNLGDGPDVCDECDDGGDGS